MHIYLNAKKDCIYIGAANDALAASVKNLGNLMNRKNYFFVPMVQDDIVKKPTSLVADFDKIPESVENAFIRKQTLPMFI